MAKINQLPVQQQLDYLSAQVAQLTAMVEAMLEAESLAYSHIKAEYEARSQTTAEIHRRAMAGEPILDEDRGAPDGTETH
jgi:outer membrane murein-binding lipoprotein Lpp